MIKKLVSFLNAMRSLRGDDQLDVAQALRFPAILAEECAAENLLLLGRVDRTEDVWAVAAGGKDDEQIAGVLTYIRNSFGNKASATKPEQVAALRGEVGKPQITAAELIKP